MKGLRFKMILPMKLDSKIFVAGHNGLVGSAIVRKLKEQGYTNIITMPKSKLDLRDQKMVAWFFSVYKPEYVFLAAAKVGGINYNKVAPADFIYDNLQIQNNVIHNANKYNVTKLLFLGSACIYPKITPQPIKEEYLLSDYLEPTNEGYALAKIAGLKMCNYYRQQYGLTAISLIPANLYGVNDNFNIEQCHVIPAMIDKFVKAKETGESVTLFGDGSPTREFLYVDDLAEACIFLMNTYDSPEHINIGSSEEYTILELANLIADKVGFTGDIIWDTEKPNGTPKRKLDISRLESLGWKSSIALDEGLTRTVDWYLETGGKRNA
jgi:GDP-L-fucose synthase